MTDYITSPRTIQTRIYVGGETFLNITVDENCKLMYQEQLRKNENSKQAWMPYDLEEKLKDIDDSAITLYVCFLMGKGFDIIDGRTMAGCLTIYYRMEDSNFSQHCYQQLFKYWTLLAPTIYDGSSLTGRLQMEVYKHLPFQVLPTDWLQYSTFMESWLAESSNKNVVLNDYRPSYLRSAPTIDDILAERQALFTRLVNNGKDWLQAIIQLRDNWSSMSPQLYNGELSEEDRQRIWLFFPRRLLPARYLDDAKFLHRWLSRLDNKSISLNGRQENFSTFILRPPMTAEESFDLTEVYSRGGGLAANLSIVLTTETDLTVTQSVNHIVMQTQKIDGKLHGLRLTRIGHNRYEVKFYFDGVQFGPSKYYDNGKVTITNYFIDGNPLHSSQGYW